MEDKLSNKLSKVKILAIGVSCLDTINCVDAFPTENKKIRVSHKEEQGGGNASNMLTSLSRLGANCYLLSAIGKDSIGKTIKEILQSDGIKTDLILEVDNVQSPSSTVIVNTTSKSRTAIFYPSISYEIDLPISENILKEFTWIHFDGRFHNAELKLAELARKYNIPISVEAERLGLKAEDHFPYAKIVFTSEHFPNDLYGENLDNESCQKKILSLGPEIVITTLGEKGCLIGTKKEFIYIPAFKRDQSQIVDTTGAGDCFIGSFLYAYNIGLGLEECGRFANYMAAMKCGKIGARKGILYKKDILANYIYNNVL